MQPPHARRSGRLRSSTTTVPATAVPSNTKTRTRAVIVLGALAIALVVASLVAAGTGQLHVSPTEVLGSVLHHIGIDAGPEPAHPNGDAVLWDVRFPRVVMALLVGSALGVAGALMQGVFSNPLAEPAVVGVSS